MNKQTIRAVTEAEKSQLLQAAVDAQKRAYAPYSDYPVGAALLTATGDIYTGCNIENASYPATVCAERVAIWKAVSEGQSDFVGIMIVTKNAASPCGICRQVMNEFEPDMTVFLADPDHVPDGNTYTVKDLLPEGFGPKQLTQE